VDVVLLLRQVALDLVNQLAPRLQIRGPPLPHEEIVQHGVVDVAAVARLARVVLAEEEAVGFEERGDGAPGCGRSGAGPTRGY